MRGNQLVVLDIFLDGDVNPKRSVLSQMYRRHSAHAVMHPLCHDSYKIAFSSESLPWLLGLLYGHSETNSIDTKTLPSITWTENDSVSVAKFRFKSEIRYMT